MIRVFADNQNDPHSEINVKIMGDGNLILHEASAMLNEIYKFDPALFDDIVKGVIRKNVDSFWNRFEGDYDDSRTE